MKPVSTEIEFKNDLKSPVKAFIFDVYGTLFISGSGDIGATEGASKSDAPPAAGRSILKKSDLLADAFRAAGFPLAGEEAGAIGQTLYQETILTDHKGKPEIDYPEVEIRSVWKRVCENLSDHGILPKMPDARGIEKIAVEYETRTNPVWPMPDLAEVLEELKQRALVMGIVSNAQFYTPLLFPALLKHEFDYLGIIPELCVWSYERGAGKPSSLLFPPLLRLMGQKYGIAPEEVLYIGNDMLKDVYTASRAGCRTCLYAGDRRSLRLRENNGSCTNLQPNAIVIRLKQLLRLL